LGCAAAFTPAPHVPWFSGLRATRRYYRCVAYAPASRNFTDTHFAHRCGTPHFRHHFRIYHGSPLPHATLLSHTRAISPRLRHTFATFTHFGLRFAVVTTFSVLLRSTLILRYWLVRLVGSFSWFVVTHIHRLLLPFLPDYTRTMVTFPVPGSATAGCSRGCLGRTYLPPFLRSSPASLLPTTTFCVAHALPFCRRYYRLRDCAFAYHLPLRRYHTSAVLTFWFSRLAYTTTSPRLPFSLIYIVNSFYILDVFFFFFFFFSVWFW